MNTSILVKEVIEKHLNTARRNLERDGALQPVLFLHIAGDDTLVMPLSLPDRAENRALVFFELGYRLSQRGLQLSEALFLAESWFVATREAPAAMQLPPSEHPARQEAIIVVGRDAGNSRYTQVVQPFTRDAHNRPTWQAIPMAVYAEQRANGNGSVGLLDCLFEATPPSR